MELPRAPHFPWRSAAQSLHRTWRLIVAAPSPMYDASPPASARRTSSWPHLSLLGINVDRALPTGLTHVGHASQLRSWIG
uniref:Uncharacterized protein n=1 Tax=Zea mays TaxID=4577 RepID=A0A804N4B4_MAIZE